MLSSMSSGAILSKTRAMFGRRLTSEDYAVLSQKRDLAGAASYLVSLEGYRDLLDGTSAASLRRREFEGMLRHRHFKNFESLCRYELSIGEKFSDYILLSTEIELITRTLSRVMSTRTDDGVFMSASPYLDKRLKLDIPKMATAQSYAELLDAVRASVFYPVLKRFSGGPAGELTVYENALYAEYYRRIFNTVDSSLSGTARDTLRDIFTSKIDLENLVRVVRFKEHFTGASPEIIRTSLLPLGNVTGEAAVSLAECENSGAVIALAGSMKPFRRKLGELSSCRRIDELPERYILKRCLHEIHFSPYPAVVMISYLYTSEIEISNIIKIVEGIRYGLPPSKITELLILPADKAGE